MEKKISIQRALLDLYLEYRNDYLSLDRFAEHKGLTSNEARTLLELGKRFHEENAEHYKTTGQELYLP